MKYRKLRDLKVSPIRTGCMGFSHGYGEVPERKYAVEAIRKAHDFGCTFFDTASFKKLRTDYADLYYLHRINELIPVEDVAGVMGQLIDEGIIKAWGAVAGFR